MRPRTSPSPAPARSRPAGTASRTVRSRCSLQRRRTLRRDQSKLPSADRPPRSRHSRCSHRCSFRAAEEQLRGRAGVDAAVFCLRLRDVARAAALHDGHLPNRLLGLHAEDGGELFCRLRAAGDAEICLCAGLEQRFRIAVAAGKAARAAVRAGRQPRIAGKRSSSFTAITLDATESPTPQIRPMMQTTKIGTQISISAPP